MLEFAADLFKPRVEQFPLCSNGYLLKEDDCFFGSLKREVGFKRKKKIRKGKKKSTNLKKYFPVGLTV